MNRVKSDAPSCACPFCHTPGEQLEVIEIDRSQWAVTCPKCGAIGPQHPSQSAAVRRWNSLCILPASAREPVVVR